MGNNTWKCADSFVAVQERQKPVPSSYCLKEFLN